MDHAIDDGLAKLEGVEEAPCYYPTVAQFAEPLEYIASIRPDAERYGICRICPPPGWKPQFAHKPDKLKFATKEQDLGKLAGAQRLRRKFTENLRKFLFLIGKPMESAHGGKVFLNSEGGGPVDMFHLFKEVQKMGGHEVVTREGAWVALARRMGFLKKSLGLQDVYFRYLADFEAVHSGKGLDFDGVVYSPPVYREKPSVEADIRVGMSLWHFLEEDQGAGRCYHGSVKALRGASNCIVEYTLAERFPESQGRTASWEIGPSSSAAAERSGGWSGAGSRSDASGRRSGACWASYCEEVEPFRVTLPKAQLSTLILNGKSPAAAKLAAHGVVCEVCSIAAASKNVLAVCVACDSAYHLGCVEPALPRVPFHDWFCGDCAKDGHSAEELARGPGGLFSFAGSSSASAPSAPLVSSPSPKKTRKHASTGSISKLPTAATVAAAAAAASSGKSGSPATPDKAVSRADAAAAAAAAAAASAAAAAAGNGSPVRTRKTRGSSPLKGGPARAKGDSPVRGAKASAPAGDKDGAASVPAAAPDAGMTTPKRAVKKEQAEDGDGEDEGDDEGDDEDDDDDEGSASDSGEAPGASLSASRMRGVSRMKGRALKYGFGNGGVFTLKEFALMADGWRSSYLARRGLGDEATEAEMEAEFWKLVGPDPPEDDVKVLYGSDLDTGAVGSGFPWTRGAMAAPGKAMAARGKPSAEKAERPKPGRPPAGRGWDYAPDPTSYEDHSYEGDAWNLNCLPTSDGSLLQFLGTQIQGVMVPWLYVGMAFSAFCWHNEDHYLYSINYLHAGSPKRWYGVPGSMAEKFESTVQLMFPELFEAHPDLLMQLVTMAHPSEVAKRGVPVSATTQREGEFVLTFPQAYHAGFNMGTNCAEAVNFAPPDWIPWGNAAQERYRLHKRKPVFSHEGLVLSLADLLSKNASDGVHASGELTRFLRNELTVLAASQDREREQAEALGCTRFESMEKLAERLRGSCNSSGASEALGAAAVSVSSIVRRSSTCGDSSGSGKDNGCADDEGSGGRDGVLKGVESGSAVQGPQCSVCDQYCFLTAVVCDTCDCAGTGRTLARASSSGSPAAGVDGGAAARRRQSRRRFACGRHLEELCSCPASAYTYYQRKDAAQLRTAAEGLTSSEEHTQTWVDEAKSALAAAKATGGGMVSSFRAIKAKSGGGGGGDAAAATAAAAAPEDKAASTHGVKLEAKPSDEVGEDAPSLPQEQQPRPPSAGASANGDGENSGDHGADEPEAMDLQLDLAVDEDEAPPPSSLLPAGWNERPSLRYIGDLIRVGEELGAPEQSLDGLRQVVDACAGWVKTIEGILGPVDSDGTSPETTAALTLFGTAKRAAATSHSGDDGDESGGGIAGGGRGRSGRAASAREGSVRCAARGEASTSRRREQVPFHKAIKLLSTEAKLPGRPAETTERLCVAILGACRLRLQVRSLLGLGEDEHVMAARAMCLTIQDAGRKASPLELASSSVKPPDGNGAAGADASVDSRPTPPDTSGGSRSSSPCHAQGGGAFSAPPAAGAPDADSKHGVAEVISSSRSGSSRTRTRTNVSLPTGTLAAERGTWKLQPWRLWPVHQSAAAALVEPCLKSAVAIPEVALLRKALAALADRTDQALRMVDSGSTGSESAGVKRGRDRSGVGGVDAAGGLDGDGGSSGGSGSGGGSGGGGGGGGGGRGRLRGSSGSGGKARLSGTPAVQAGGSLKGSGVAGGGVLVGAAQKRRRNDDS